MKNSKIKLNIINGNRKIFMEHDKIFILGYTNDTLELYSNETDKKMILIMLMPILEHIEQCIENDVEIT